MIATVLEFSGLLPTQTRASLFLFFFTEPVANGVIE